MICLRYKNNLSINTTGAYFSVTGSLLYLFINIIIIIGSADGLAQDLLYMYMCR